MKKSLLILLVYLISWNNNSWGNHITGGEIYYTCVGPNGSGFQYHVTLKLFRDHFSTGAALDLSAALGVFDRGSHAMIWNASIPKTREVRLQLTSPSPCINNPPVVDYDVGYYEFDVILPDSPNGYIIAYQRCCRISGINNLANSVSVGATYTAEIPGNKIISTAPKNNSAQFVGADTVIVCAHNQFLYSFAAFDADGDQLSYSFCNAYLGGNSTNQPAPNPPVAPDYFPVPYSTLFSGASPMGPTVTLNPNTGLITGIAPDAGIYVVTVCVTETRNGELIATQRKDLQIKIGDCDVARALLNPQYITCDGFTMTFQNLSASPLINSHFWDFGVTGTLADTSNLAIPTFTYPDTGAYTIKLVTNRRQQCSDSTTAVVKVYPGFFPAFTSSGICITNPVRFFDATSTVYGVVNTWSWNFGDAGSAADTSHIKNPQYTYPNSGPKDITLIVTNSKGCVDTVTNRVDVIDKPPINLAFTDTLICIPDAVQLGAAGSGVFTWTPNTNISNTGIPNPTVNPSTTTTYYVDLDLSGCKNKDSVLVRVTNAVSLSVRADTTSCQGDPVQLLTNSNGLTYLWSPAGTLDDPTAQNPIASPTTTTTYQVLATVGTCSATDQVTVITVPYPFVNAGPDTIVCYNTAAQLFGTFIGSSFIWSPGNFLSNPNIVNPIAQPPRTTTFLLTVLDTLGCPKPGLDSVKVTVLPRVRAYAGRDTTVVVGQPLQFDGNGGTVYLWSPSTGLNDVNIPNPIGVYGPEIDSVRYKLIVTDLAGCEDSAFVQVIVFKTNPSIFVPSAFTPNGDGLNDVIAPIAVGIQKIFYFSIYNRWGQRVFITSENGRGWDGRINGKAQASDVFVWMVNAEDYTGRKIFLKGTVALIR